MIPELRCAGSKMDTVSSDRKYVSTNFLSEKQAVCKHGSKVRVVPEGGGGGGIRLSTLLVEGWLGGCERTACLVWPEITPLLLTYHDSRPSETHHAHTKTCDFHGTSFLSYIKGKKNHRKKSFGKMVACQDALPVRTLFCVQHLHTFQCGCPNLQKNRNLP